MPPSTDAPPASISELASCIGCSARLDGRASCPACGRSHPLCDGVLDAISPLEGRNAIVAAFYDGPGWARFRPWEHGFLAMVGGARRARLSILRHVLAVATPDARVLEVGINDGENLRFLPAGWEIHGVDIARTQLQACQRKHLHMTNRLALAEAERLPFPDATFDACFTIGGFNYFSDHAQALREMRRVTRPGGPVVVADERPDLHRAGLGHLIGLPALDAWWLRRLGLDREFVAMVLRFREDPSGLALDLLPGSTLHRIWRGLGYCIVDPGDPAASP